MSQISGQLPWKQITCKSLLTHPMNISLFCKGYPLWKGAILRHNSWISWSYHHMLTLSLP